MSKPAVSIVIVNYNSWGVLFACLNSLQKLDYKNFEVVVVDNASPNEDLQAKKLLKKAKDVNLIESEKNLGFAGGCNLGAKKTAKYDYIWFLNPDTLVEKDTLSQLVKKALEYKKDGKKVGMIGGKQMLYSETNKIYSVYKTLDKKSVSIPHIGYGEVDSGQYESKDSVDYINGSSMFVTKEFIKDVGLMDESWFLDFEEIDWQEQGKQKGWKIAYCAESKLCHRVSHSINSFNDGYYMTRNHLYFTDKYFSDKSTRVLIDKIWQMVKMLLKGRGKWFVGAWRGLLDYFVGKKGTV